MWKYLVSVIDCLGIATAEELVRQREKLEKTDKQLDEINATLRFSQKHINGIKSVFSSLKNYMSGRNNESSPTSSSSVAKVITHICFSKTLCKSFVFVVRNL